MEIPDSVTSIGYDAFYGCESLETVTYNGALAQWCAMYNDSELMRNAKSVILPGEHNMDLKQATTLEIPGDVERIESYAFYDCTAITDVTSIGDNAFYWCDVLKEIRFNGTVEQWKAIQGSDKVMIPCIQCDDGYLGIKDIPECLKMNGTQVVGYTGEVPAALVIPNGVTSIGDSTFYMCEKLNNVTIPDSVKSIGEYAFENCSLTSVTIPDGVTSIEEYTFRSCSRLTSVTIPDNVKSIGNSAFKYCYALTTINYTGTEEQWNAITKGSDWDAYTGDYTITYNYTE